MKNRWLKVGLSGFFAAIFGVLGVFSFAPFYIFPLAIVAIAGLLALILNKTAKMAGFLGFMFGLGFFGAGVYWVFISVHSYGEVPAALAGLVTTGLIAILALFPASACYASNRYFPNTTRRKLIFAFPAMWLISEWVRSWVACGFTWLFLGYSQTNSPLKGFAAILSVYGVSLAVLMSSGFIISAIKAYRQKLFKELLQDLIYLACIWLGGALLSLIPWTVPEGKPLNVTLVQGNIPQSIKWSREYLDLSYKRYVELSLHAWGRSDLIIWPESAIPNELQDSAWFIDHIDKIAKASKTNILLGIPVKAGKDSYYNAAITLGQTQDFYFKRRLVPFGEYVPFQWISEKILNFMNVPMSNMVPGSYKQHGVRLGNINVDTSICFEITFPELIHTYDRSVGMLVTITNDAWFNDSIAAAQHIQMAQMRAMELGRPVLFVSNDGITAIIGSHGEIEAEAPTHEAFTLNGTVQPMIGATPWMVNFMDPLLVIVILFIYLSRRELKKSPLKSGAKMAIQQTLSK